MKKFTSKFIVTLVLAMLLSLVPTVNAAVSSLIDDEPTIAYCGGGDDPERDPLNITKK